ncbi:MAG: hypothetical protein EAX87_04230 [Candidatus Thorarchaeota archaeon]|nr:hypothetical protein [Candidatus Thorarchaeota archaeon]
MCPLENSRKRFRLFERKVDRWLLRVGQKVARSLIENRLLICVLLIGFIVWAIVFNTAVIDYTNSSAWTSRTAWLGPFPGPGTVQVFGYTIPYQIEGYSDYSFYYVHWGYNSLYGVMPYSPDYGVLTLDGITNKNGAFLFPPFTSYFYAAGIALGNLMGWENWGIGLLIAALGYLTALPVYGIAKELSSNRRVGEAAALTYLLNPLMLYHTDFLWFNPAPFVFFFFAGFYMLVRGHRLSGTLLIVSAALFKQTAWFLGIPLVVYLLVKPRVRRTANDDETESSTKGIDEDKKERSFGEKITYFLQPFADYFDFRNFLISVVVVLIFVGAVMLPYLIAQPGFWNYWRLALGSFSFEGNYTDPPPYNVPMRIQVLAIIAGKPELAKLLDTIIVSGGPLGFGVVLCAGMMVLKDKFIGEEKLYFRRILFMTLLLLLIVTILGPRGVFKYYFVMLMPFFSIFSSARMIRGTEEHIPFSASMVWLPITFTLLILIPDRNIYLAYVLLIFFGYLLAPLFDRLYHIAKSPFRYIRKQTRKMSNIVWTPLTAEEDLTHFSRRRSLANIGVQVFTLGLGLSLILFGWWSVQMAIAVDIVTGLEVILFFSAAFVMGFQLLSIALSFGLESELRLTYLNSRLHEFSLLAAVILWVYNILTYFQSWPIDIAPERQLLVLSSVFVSIWTASLLVDQSNKTRILTDGMLLGGLGVSLFIWHALSNPNIFFLGGIGFIAIVVHLLFVLVHYSDRNIVDQLREERATQLADASSDFSQKGGMASE